MSNLRLSIRYGLAMYSWTKFSSDPLWRSISTKKKYTKLMENMLIITPSHLLNNKRQNPTDQVWAFKKNITTASLCNICTIWRLDVYSSVVITLLHPKFLRMVLNLNTISKKTQVKKPPCFNHTTYYNVDAEFC